MSRLLALCSLPRTNPGDWKEYKRVNGPYALYMNTTAWNKLPFGNIPRLLMAWVCTEAVRTQSVSWFSVLRFPSSCGSWICTPAAGVAGATGSGFATR